MNEKLLFAALTEPITTYLTALGVADFPLIKANQTEVEGRVERGAYLSRVTKQTRGWQGHNTRQGITSMMQNQQDTYQIQCYTPNDPSNATQQTATDLAEIIRMILQSPQYIAGLQAQGIGMQRPTDVKPLVFKNEADQYEDYPTFEFTVSYKSSIVLPENEITSIDPDIHEV